MTTGFGARFLAAFRELGGSPSTWKFAELAAIGGAEREGFADLLRHSTAGLPFRVLDLCTSATPEDLARAVLDELRRQAAGAIVITMAMGAWTL
jgi:hypothetical protein